MTGFPSLFVTGTDTGVGKTVLCAAILAGARARGIDAVPMKPIQTGCIRLSPGRRVRLRQRATARQGAPALPCRDPAGTEAGPPDPTAIDQLVAPDLEFCLSAAGLNPPIEERRWMCPYRFMMASSPHLAAARARVHLLEETIGRNFRKILAKSDAVVVEGAGGVLVPIGGGRTMLNVMKALRLPVLLAARPGLGTLNHTLLSVHELERAKLRIAGIVLVDSTPAPWGPIEKDNQRTIRDLAGVDFVARLPYLPRFAQGRATASELRRIGRFFQSFEEALGAD